MASPLPVAKTDDSFEPEAGQGSGLSPKLLRLLKRLRISGPFRRGGVGPKITPDPPRRSKATRHDRSAEQP